MMFFHGIQIQLLTYLDAACKEEDLMPAGILYFSMLEQMIKSDRRMEQEEIEEKIRANFKMKGLILADVKVVKLHDKNLQTLMLGDFFYIMQETISYIASVPPGVSIIINTFSSFPFSTFIYTIKLFSKALPLNSYTVSSV